MSDREFTPAELARTVGESLDPFNPREAAERIARAWGLNLEELFDKGPHSRERPKPQARAALYRVLRARGWSLTAIGRFVGGRDHTTVLNVLGSEERRLARAKWKKAWHARRKERAA